MSTTKIKGSNVHDINLQDIFGFILLSWAIYIMDVAYAIASGKGSDGISGKGNLQGAPANRVTSVEVVIVRQSIPPCTYRRIKYGCTFMRRRIYPRLVYELGRSGTLLQLISNPPWLTKGGVHVFLRSWSCARSKRTNKREDYEPCHSRRQC